MDKGPTARIEPHGQSAEFPHAPGFTVEGQGAGRYRLGVTGSFTPGWLARLSAGLSDHQVSILHGQGAQLRASYWEAEFDLEKSPGAVDPASLDFRSLVEKSLPKSRDEHLELKSFTIAPAENAGQAVWVEVSGIDKIGFLRNVLNAFAFYALFPCEVQVATQDNLVRDRFLLRGIAGTAPSANALQGLRDWLESFLVR
jgi:UTP:GlnB (protein PII) uridylyltransferase